MPSISLLFKLISFSLNPIVLNSSDNRFISLFVLLSHRSLCFHLYQKTETKWHKHNGRSLADCNHSLKGLGRLNRKTFFVTLDTRQQLILFDRCSSSGAKNGYKCTVGLHMHTDGTFSAFCKILSLSLSLSPARTHTHTHTHTRSVSKPHMLLGKNQYEPSLSLSLSLSFHSGSSYGRAFEYEEDFSANLFY